MKKIFLVLCASACVLQHWGQGTLQLTPNAKIITSGAAYLVLDNMHVVNDGSFQQTVGNGFVKLTGGLNVNLSGSSETIFNQLLLAKTGPDTIITLLSNISVVDSVKFTRGLLNLNNSILNLRSTGAFSTDVSTRESETSRAFTTGSGYIQRSGVLSSPSSVNLGNLGAVITSNTNLGNTTVRRGHKVQTGIWGSNNSISRYFDIIPDINMALKATLRFYYFNAELNSIPEATLYHWQSPNLVNWNLMGADSRDVSANWVERKTYGKFDRVTLATASAPTITCPANKTVSANMSGCKASVSFAATATGTPTPSIAYRIGNTVITSPYVFSKGTTTITTTASNGVTPDATCTFTVTVVCGGGPVTIVSGDITEQPISDKLVVTARPNPSTDYFTLDIKSSTVQPVTIRVMDMLGRAVSVYSNVASNGTLYIGHKYLPGIYFVQATRGKEIVTLKLIKQAN
jgi:hypothetical protein